MSAVSILFLFLWSEFCYCRAVWCLTWDGLYCPMKTWLSREVGRQFNSCQCISRRHQTVWKASSLPHHPTLFFFTKAWRKAATWEGREKNIWKLEVLSDNFKREQEFKKKVEAKKKALLNWPRISHFLLFLFSKLPPFLLSVCIIFQFCLVRIIIPL